MYITYIYHIYIGDGTLPFPWLTSSNSMTLLLFPVFSELSILLFPVFSELSILLFPIFSKLSILLFHVSHILSALLLFPIFSELSILLFHVSHILSALLLSFIISKLCWWDPFQHFSNKISCSIVQWISMWCYWQSKDKSQKNPKKQVLIFKYVYENGWKKRHQLLWNGW